MVNKRGEGNVLLTPDIIAREYLMRLMESLVIPRLASFDYRGYFEGAIGAKITIKKPYYGILSKGRSLQANQINPMVDDTIELAVDKRFKGALTWNDEEMTLDIDQFSERYLDALVEDLGIRFDQDGGRALSNSFHMISGEPGTGFTQDKAADIRAYALEAGIPMGMNTFGLLNAIDSSQVQKDLAGTAGQSGKFNESMVSQNIRSHFVGALSNHMMFETNHIEPQEVVKAGAAHRGGTVNGANQRGDTINMDGFGVNGTRVFRKGQIFTIAGVYQTFPRSWDEEFNDKRSTGRLMPFTVTEDVVTTGAGAAAVKISPALNDGELTTTDSKGANVSLKAFQNVTAAAADNAVVTVIGWPGNAATTGVRYRQNIFYNRRALHYVPVQLKQASSAVEQYRTMDPQTNVSISATKFFDGNEMEEILRLDTFYGVKNIYPELGIRYWSTQIAG